MRRRAAEFRERHPVPSSSCRSAESVGSKSSGRQSRLIPCFGNHVFFCPVRRRAHKDSRCREGSQAWKKCYLLLGAHSFDKRKQGDSLQAMVEKLPWWVRLSLCFVFKEWNFFFPIFFLFWFCFTVRIVNHFWSSFCFLCLVAQENQCRCGPLGDKIVRDCCPSHAVSDVQRPAVPRLRASRLLHSICSTAVV